ncbi:MAG: polysaccharide biosynthesis/export family protein [Bacteroidales bacterium]|nr:polysaccharide biosynthesis/export family protein [Bacteroidales bacterium]
MKKQIGLLFTITALLLSMSSCGSWKQVAYFQNHESINNTPTPTPTMVMVRPGDKISIYVKTSDPETGELFNLINLERSYQTGNSKIGYTIDANGNIDFPELGVLHVAGHSRSQIAQMIKSELEKKGQANNAIVTVEFLDLTVSVLGEVRNPGRFLIDKDVISIIDAIGMAGDLTIDGERKNVMVMRSENGKQTIYTINMCDAENVLSSPAYYLQQNDVVYVQPTTKKARTSTVNGNNALSASFWLSVASTAVTVFTFIFAVKK